MEVAGLILGACVVAIAFLPAAGSILIWHFEQKAKEKKDAEPTYPEVEPPSVPEDYRYINRDELDDRCRADLQALFEKQFKRPPADDFDPQTGDVVTAYVEHVSDGQGRQTARVLWPRGSYVRARLYGLRPGQDGARPRVTVDIPRSAIAGVLHMTAPT